ncbi:thiamine biosynthesis protein ThiF [Flavisphingomonas formosensis]|uniref:thiamine biosynthesis protein ThiF n=1 Tax=Flavisphingomonas formosensis TaxID=861534 RepID=UPI0012FBD629|nr:thiamine biosynthesis protein ThiF [Sphingomonas formosensis]
MDDLIEGLNRSAKLFVDSGVAATVEEAMDRLRAFRLHIVIGERASRSPTHQAALLTALNCGRRTFLGGVTVSGALQEPLAVRIAPAETLADAVRHLKGQIVQEAPEGVPVIAIGTALDPADGFAVRTTFSGWRGGIVPASATPLDEATEFALSGALAGALGVAEAFAHMEGDIMAGNRAVGLSLWHPAADWRSAMSDGSVPDVLPADFWLIGLGHLGQAFLWAIGLLPYPDPAEVRLFLQDVDVAGASTESTSVLTTAADMGEMKTRVCEEWARARGFRSMLIERRFGHDLRVAPDEPALGLCGVDNPQARALLEGAGFATVFEAGLGDGSADFRLIRTHSFPAPVSAAEVWADQDEAAVIPELDSLPSAYRDLSDRGTLDQCGVTKLAQVAVGAPFVGMVAAAVVIAQTVRMTTDGMRATVCNLDLTCLQHRSMVMREGSEAVIFKTTKA